MAARDRRRRWPLSIRLRLTLLYAGVLAGTLLLFGVALHETLSRTLTAAGDRFHVEATTRTASTVTVEIAPDGSLVATLPFSRGFRSPPPGPGLLAQIVDLKSAQVVASSPNLFEDTMPFTPGMLAAAQRGETFLETIRLEGQRFRMIGVPVIVGGRPVAVLQVARSLAQEDFLLGQLRWLLVVLAGISLPAAAGLGWLVAGRSLAPIRVIAGTAADIGRARDFARRIAHPGPADELGHLGDAINVMLAELERAHRDVARSAREAEQALAAQRRFAADASHELRTPLTTIRVNAELLQHMEADGGSERAKALADIAEEADRLGRLVDQLLMLARADAGLRLTLRPTALRPIVEEACRQAQVLAGGRDLELVAPQEVEVSGDPDALKQLTLILVDNGLKYTPAGGRISVHLRGSDDGAELSVGDTGPGIAPADIARVFDRFYRSDTARQADGTGLGLSIAKWIADQHGAHIAVASVLGQGTTFTVRFPASRPQISSRSASGPNP